MLCNPLSPSPTGSTIGVIVPIVVTAIVLLGLWAWRKYHRRSPSILVEQTPPEERQPYLQQKAELEDEARRRHELDGQERRCEIDGNEIHELPERCSRHGMMKRQRDTADVR